MNHSRDNLIKFSESYFRALTSNTFGREVKWLESAGSTNDVARAWADEGASEGSLVFANHQVAGKGRHGRIWTDVPHQNLTISLVLRPRMAAETLGVISLAAGVAVAESIAGYSPGQGVSLKWPNDVRIEGRKCCGILSESFHASSSEDLVVILGVGLNVNQDVFEGDLYDSATSLSLAFGQPVNRVEILALLLKNLEERYGQSKREPERIIGDYANNLDGVGQHVTVYAASGRPTGSGILLGVDSTGALILQTDEGRRTYHAGEITFHSH